MLSGLFCASRWTFFTVLASAILCLSLNAAKADFSYDFEADDGSFTVSNRGGVEDPWVYQPGAWSVGGSTALGTPSSSGLRTPTYQLDAAGSVVMSFDHRYSIEWDGTTRWDGAALMMSVNGSAFTHVDGGLFETEGYVDVIGGNNVLAGFEGFSDVSVGYFDEEYVTSVVDFGSFNAGDKVQFEFLGAWDEFARGNPDGTVPNWEIDSVSVVGQLTVVPDLPPPPAQEFYEIESVTVTTEDTDLWPISNLIQGPGVGFDDAEPYDSLGGGAGGAWVTEACGFPCDYLDSFDPPEIVLDLGSDVPLSQIDVWGYAGTNANGVLEFEVEFATEADGDTGFGTSITYNPTFTEVDIDPVPRQQFPFDETVTARYVLVRTTDNYFEEPGDGSGELGRPPGGDRIGLSEIAFPILGGRLLGDFNGNGVLDIEDIDSLTSASAGGTNMPASFDLTGDGVVDGVDVTVWIKDLAVSWIGDSNLDGEFSSTDFVQIFTAGKFELDVDAVWSEGDWNGDGRFNSSDFVAAFTDGGFELGPRTRVSAVPEPSALVSIFLGSVLAAGLYRRRT